MLIAGKLAAVLMLEAIQLVLVGTLGLVLGWHPKGDPLVAVVLVVLGSAAFAGLGLLLAGTLRAEVTLAAANLLWFVLLFGGGIAIPLSRFPDGVASVLRLTPPPHSPTVCTRCCRTDRPCPSARLSSLPCGPRRPGGGGPVVPVGVASRLLGWRRSLVALQRLALASVVVNVAIVVTGGAVRLTNSGLGCPTWPKCDGDSLIPTRQNAIHGLIEFGNRTFTFVLVLVAAATLLAAWSQRRSVSLALVAFLVIPAQAVVGGVAVLTDLNPWVVSAHLAAVHGQHRGDAVPVARRSRPDRPPGARRPHCARWPGRRRRWPPPCWCWAPS